jgi:two-component system LytT family response regulator
VSSEKPAQLRAIVVDDEPLARDLIRALLAKHQDVDVVGEAAGADAAALIARTRPDIMFLDIQMPEVDGFRLLEMVGPDAVPAIVFVTAYDRYALRAFDVHALDYLLKPLNDERLAQALERAEALLRHGQRAAYGKALRGWVEPSASPWLERISVRSVGRVEQVRVADILWVEAAGNYVNLCLAGRQVLHRIPLSRLETLLDPAVFLRVHRGAIVRRDQIGSLATVGDGSYRLALRCGAHMAVSERYVQALRAHM